MTWQAIIEINNSRSPYLNEIIDLARRTASDMKITGKRLEFIYNGNKAMDLDIMLNKVGSWKSTVVFVSGHIIRAHALSCALDCLLYRSEDSGCQKEICKYCPIGRNCEKSTRCELNRISRRWEVEQRNIRYKIYNPPDEGDLGDGPK
jgi:hypothetical protein